MHEQIEVEVFYVESNPARAHVRVRNRTYQQVLASHVLNHGIIVDAIGTNSVTFDQDGELFTLQEGEFVLRNNLDIRYVLDAPNPGLLTTGNLDINRRPCYVNEDGSISTVLSMSFNDDVDEVLIPTVLPPGEIVSEDDAIAHYEATGEHLGKFDTPESAEAYAIRLHAYQESILDAMCG